MRLHGYSNRRKKNKSERTEFGVCRFHAAGSIKQPPNPADVTHSKILHKKRHPWLAEKALSSLKHKQHGKGKHRVTGDIFQLFLGALCLSQSDIVAEPACFRSQATGI